MSTIAARRLDCRVRNEIGYDPPAKPPEPNIRNVQVYKTRIGIEDYVQTNDCATQISARETGHISTPRLHASRRFHLEPINLVIFEEPHNDS